VNRKKKSKRLNPMRIKLLKEMAKGKSLTKAAKIAGYGTVQAASLSLRRAKLTMPDIMDKAGLTDESLIHKYLTPLMNANKTIFFQNGGVVMDKRTVPALEIRQSSLDMAFRLKNKYPNKLEVEHGGVITHVLSESDKKDAIETLKRIAAFEGDESSPDVIDGEVVDS